MWGRSDAPTFQKSGVYLTDLKRQFGTLGKGGKVEPDVDVVPVGQDPEKGGTVVPELAKGGPKIIDCGMNGTPLPSTTGRPWISSPLSPTGSNHIFYNSKTKGSVPTPLSPVPMSPAPKTPASKLAKEWKKDEGRRRRDTSHTKTSFGSSFGQPYPVERGPTADPMPPSSNTQGAHEQPSSRSADQSTRGRTQPPRGRHRDSNGSLDFVLPRERMTDQRAAPPQPQGSRRPPTNFSLDTSSTPSMYSTSTPAQSMYVPSSGARLNKSPALSGKSGTVPPPQPRSKLSISIPKPGSPDRTRLQVRKSQSASSLHSPHVSSPLASGSVASADWTTPRFQAAPGLQERDWRVSVISTHAM